MLKKSCICHIMQETLAAGEKLESGRCVSVQGVTGFLWEQTKSKEHFPEIFNCLIQRSVV